MAAIDQPAGHALTIREAAAACRLSPRTIRRKLTDGSFPNAYKTGGERSEREGIWMIPVADLEAAGLEPTSVHPTLSQAIRPATDSELEAAVRVETARPCSSSCAPTVSAGCAPSSPRPSPPPRSRCSRAEAERWRVLADERAAGARPRRHRAQGAHDRDGCDERDRTARERVRAAGRAVRRPRRRLLRCRSPPVPPEASVVPPPQPQAPPTARRRHRRGAAARARGSDALHRVAPGAARSAQAAERSGGSSGRVNRRASRDRRRRAGQLRVSAEA